MSCSRLIDKSINSNNANLKPNVRSSSPDPALLSRFATEPWHANGVVSCTPELGFL